MIDEHWKVGHQVIGEEAMALKADKNPHLRIAACAQRFVKHLGEMYRYDLEVILGSLNLSIIEHDLLPLTDGVWLPGVKSMPAEIRAKRLKGNSALRMRMWMKLGNQILRNPWNVVDVVENPTLRVPSGKQQGWLSLRFSIFKRDNYRCRMCGVSTHDGENVRLEVDHITPRSKGGTNDPSNLWVLCFACNRGKRAQDL